MDRKEKQGSIRMKIGTQMRTHDDMLEEITKIHICKKMDSQKNKQFCCIIHSRSGHMYEQNKSKQQNDVCRYSNNTGRHEYER